MRLTEGMRVRTKAPDLGPGRIRNLKSGRDTVPPHGQPTRGVAYAVVDLDVGGTRIYPARNLEPEGVSNG